MVADVVSVACRFCLVCDEVVRLGLVPNKTEFCHSVGLQVSNYNLIKSGARVVCLRRICDVVNVYGVSLEWLFFGSGSMFGGNGEGDL